MKHRNQTQISALPGQQNLIITREFNAPPEKVFKVFTEPALFVEWIGPREFVTTLESFEAVNGGSWRFIQSDAKGNSYAFHGVFHSLSEPEFIVQTFELEGFEEGHAALETLRFDALAGGKTRLTSQSVFQSAEDRDAMISAGMERGVRESHERIDDLLSAKRATSN